ncbi:hypothetical protein Hamer_G007013 [Homarus americanus]|uniref:Uncharacterized protein n=1 Tax=Homarus americanus TaxID=6706 RepID=A0A8J5N4B5_HOMAM|nr:hypothetical protein Hamer_G007013 [Homarus americanus]
MVEQTTRAMTSSPVVCLIGETEALHFTPHNQSFPQSYTSHESFPHSYTSQRVLHLLLRLTVSPSLTPKHQRDSFPHCYTSHESFPHSYTSVSPSLTPKHQRDSFPHCYTSQ